MTDNHSSQDEGDSLPDTQSSLLGEPAVTPEPSQQGKGGGKALAGLALLVAIVGAGLAGWNTYRLQQQPDQQAQPWQSDFGQLQHQVSQGLVNQASATSALQSKLAELPDAGAIAEQRRLLMSLQADQQSLAQGLSKINANNRRAWRLNEARHLVGLAQLRLMTLEDSNSALALLKAADDILLSQNDALAFAARGELAKVIEAIDSQPYPDTTGLFQRLGALREQVPQLDALMPEFNVDAIGQARQQQAANRPWWDWQRWRDTLSGYVRIQTDADSSVHPLLAEQSLAEARLALSLALEQAQWGALNAKQVVYKQAIEQASQILADYFDPGQSQPLRDSLKELAGQVVAIDPPDMGPLISSLDNYLQERQRIDNGGAPSKDEKARDDAKTTQNEPAKQQAATASGMDQPVPAEPPAPSGPSEHQTQDDGHGCCGGQAL